MEYERYISDGNLEKFFLGFATPEEEEELQQCLNVFPELQVEMDEVERRFERATFKDAAYPPAHVKTALMKQIALEATQPATSSSWYSKRNVRYENVKTPANKMTVHIGWKILLICLLGMIALSLLAVVYFSMAIK